MSAGLSGLVGLLCSDDDTVSSRVTVKALDESCRGAGRAVLGRLGQGVLIARRPLAAPPPAAAPSVSRYAVRAAAVQGAVSQHRARLKHLFLCRSSAPRCVALRSPTTTLRVGHIAPYVSLLCLCTCTVRALRAVSSRALPCRPVPCLKPCPGHPTRTPTLTPPPASLVGPLFWCGSPFGTSH